MFLLGLDGGGTGCRAALADATGRVIARASAGPANIVTDPQGARAAILAAAGAVMEGHCPPDQVCAVLGLAGANFPKAAARIAQGLPFARVQVVQDVQIAVAGALGDDDGILAAMGTGSVFAVRRADALRVIGGWGLVLGDEGSGAWIGRALMARALRGLDGFVPLTPLLRRLLDDHGGGAGLAAFAQSARPADFAALAPLVTGSDDPAAIAVMEAATVEVAAAIDLLQQGGALPVVFTGGLGPTYADRLRGRWPIRAPLGDNVDGALHMARRLAAT